MRKALFALIIAAMASNLAGGATIKDPRLAQKVTYRVKLRPISDLTADLAKLTHVTFIAGKSNSDWRVREDCATVMAKDVPLASLMDSIARAMKFRWVRSGEAPKWTYRLTEDPAAIAAVKRRQDAEKKKQAQVRQKSWDMSLAACAMSEVELLDVKDSDPWLYLSAKSGVLKPTMEFLQQVPDAQDAFLSGKELTLASYWLSTEARQALLTAARASLQLNAQLYAQDQQSKDATAAQLVELEKSRDRITCDICGSSVSFGVGNDIFGGLTIASTDSEFSRLIGQMSVKAYEQKRPMQEIRKEMKPQLQAVLKTEREKLKANAPQAGCDPGVTHPADPVLAEPLKDKVESRVITGMVESLADASGFAIVTADIRGHTDLSFAKGVPLREALDKLAGSWDYHWNRNGRTVEIWRGDWYERRNARVSKAWLERMCKKFKDNGTYDIDDMAEIASLTDEQLGRNTEPLAECSDGLYDLPGDILEYLRFYASLDSDQRSALFSDSGLDFAGLTSDQQQPVMKQLKSMVIPVLPNLDLASLGLRLNGTKERRGKAWLYTFKAYTNLGPIPGRYAFRTPVYVEPPKPEPPPKPGLVPVTPRS